VGESAANILPPAFSPPRAAAGDSALAETGFAELDAPDGFSPPAHGRRGAADDVWAAAPVVATRPLSAAQIDQVLAALDERLELLLLRTYGTSAQP
jgi:hypothetical protein